MLCNCQTQLLILLKTFLHYQLQQETLILPFHHQNPFSVLSLIFNLELPHSLSALMSNLKLSFLKQVYICYQLFQLFIKKGKALLIRVLKKNLISFNYHHHPSSFMLTYDLTTDFKQFIIVLIYLREFCRLLFRCRFRQGLIISLLISRITSGRGPHSHGTVEIRLIYI